MDSPATPTETEKEEENVRPAGSLIDLSVAVFLLTVTAMLIGNIYVINLARDYNDNACHAAIADAAKAALKGKDESAMMRAAYEAMSRVGPGGFFIEHPSFLEFKDEKVANVRQLKVQTRAVATLPAPILVFGDDDVRSRGKVEVKATYIVEFKGND